MRRSDSDTWLLGTMRQTTEYPLAGLSGMVGWRMMC